MNEHTCPKCCFCTHLVKVTELADVYVNTSVSIYEAKMIIIIICIDTQTPSGVESEKNPRK